MGLRPGRCYTNMKRSYTRKSKFKKFSFIKAVPPMKIIRFDMGNPDKKFTYQLDLISKESLQIRQNSVESARIVVNRTLHESLGLNYFFKLRLYPHHVLRENKMLTGAGADRMQTGMAHSFGRPMGLASQVKKGAPIFSIKVDKENIGQAKTALKKAAPRLSGTYRIEINEIK